MSSDDLERYGPKNGSSLVVSLKEHFERLRHEDREFIERVFHEHRLAHDQKHAADAEAIKQAREVVENRLEKLNELRAEVQEDRGQFVRIESFNAQVDALEKSIRVLEDLTKLTPTHAEMQIISGRAAAAERVMGPLIELGLGPRLVALEAFRNRAIGIGTVLVLAAGGFGFLLSKLFP